MSPRQGMSPLAIVLPHPSLSRHRAALLSPRTPRGCGSTSPTCSGLFNSTTNNRKSSDSWGSSIQDVGDDYESAWKPDHIQLLQRTLDALPSHLYTPYIGQIPPPNLIEKIARGVIDAKGTEWTHSLRATRMKLFEIARNTAIEQHRKSMESSEAGSEASQGPALKRVRPLYRQSSMDFINPSITSLQEGNSHSKLSNSHGRSDRPSTSSAYHPYSRHNRTSSIDQNARSQSPPRLLNMPSFSKTASTRNSMSSLSSISSNRGRIQARTASSLSRSSFTSSDVNGSLLEMEDGAPLPDPRVQRVRRSESFGGPLSAHVKETLSFQGPNLPSPTSPSRHGVKRSPSYGVFAQEARKRGKESIDLASSGSSDEEEKARSLKAKKTKKSSSSKPAPVQFGGLLPQTEQTLPKPKKQRMNIQRNPSILGAELPGASAPAVRPVSTSSSEARGLAGAGSPPKTLRRVKRLRPSRKIEFGVPSGQLPNSSDTDADVDGEPSHHEMVSRPTASSGLGSAFQLR